jgi:hypothetical protein
MQIQKEDRKMDLQPMLLTEVYRSRYNDLLKEAQKERLPKEAEADRPSPYARILSRMGGILIIVGLSLGAQNPSNIT